MTDTGLRIESKRLAPAVTALIVMLAVGGSARAQSAASQSAAPSPAAKAAAPIDLTGYWVSFVSQEWRWRMVTPAKGDYAGVPITLDAKKVADTWDPAKDEAAGVQCKSYGAPALMRVPGRLHITWSDDNTLKVETDAGTQVRLFRFGKVKGPAEAPSWQGHSVAEWQTPIGAPARGSSAAQKFGSLKVVTTQLRPGYLRKNGVPYSEQTILTEYWDLFKEPGAEQWVTLTSRVEDPVYLRDPWITSTSFKKEADGTKWDPVSCSARW
jgi:hypothetical protein